MFNNLGFPEIAVLVILGILIFGPERLPKVAADAGRLVRELRRMASGVTSNLKEELGVDLEEFRQLDPRRFLDDDSDPDPVTEPTAAATALPKNERPPYDPDTT